MYLIELKARYDFSCNCHFNPVNYISFYDIILFYLLLDWLVRSAERYGNGTKLANLFNLIFMSSYILDS